MSHQPWESNFETGLPDLFDVARARELQAENEKLRELVDTLWTGCPWAERPCQECGHYDGAFCDLYHSMEELGIV